METSERITVRVLKYDGTEYRRWPARLARRDGSFIVLEGEFEYDVDHSLLGSIRRGTRTEEYYWLDRWYNIFRFLDDAGGTRLYYCNVSTPPQFDGELLSYVDLDIDILVQPDLSYRVLDSDEFEAHALQYGYSEETRTNAYAALSGLIYLIEHEQFPFKEFSLKSSVSSVV